MKYLFALSLVFNVFCQCASAKDLLPMNKPQKIFAISKENIKSLIPNNTGGFATDRIMVDGLKIGYMYREITNKQEDSGWRFFYGNETQAYIDDLSHTGVYSLNTIANYDKDIIPYLNTLAPCAFEKVEGKHIFVRVTE